MSDERQNPVVETEESDFFPLAVAQHADGTISIEWDEAHPVTSIFNNWTNDDFVSVIRNGLENELTMLTQEVEGPPPIELQQEPLS